MPNSAMIISRSQCRLAARGLTRMALIAILRERVSGDLNALPESALTWWNTHVMTVTHDVAYSMTWVDLKKKMTDKIKLKDMVGGLPDMIQWILWLQKPKDMPEGYRNGHIIDGKRGSSIAERPS
ncbi:hypothetical protein Tco_0157196 [Tanacetum coccineum]